MPSFIAMNQFNPFQKDPDLLVIPIIYSSDLKKKHVKCNKKIDQRFNTLLLHIRRTSFLDVTDRRLPSDTKNSRQPPKIGQGQIVCAGSSLSLGDQGTKSS